MELSFHLTFPGTCAAAFRFYEGALRGTLQTLLTYGESPMAGQVPADWQSKVVHASLTVGGTVLAGADVQPGEYEVPQGFFVLYTAEDVAASERVFQALATDGTVRLAAQKTFWAPFFGVVVDRFGIPWEVSCAQRR
jgi:PhnB protein